MAIINYESGNLKEMATTGYKIVDFYADWCGPCKMINSVFEELNKKYPEVEIIKVNVDQYQELAAEYGVMSIPTIFIYKDNTEVEKFIGFRDVTDFENVIKS
ncbi:MAG: thioredoxin [Mollicutes bacterium]|jgi:thioredoxin 1|nr:thioredoxin [Mollicutes bacterium]